MPHCYFIILLLFFSIRSQGQPLLFQQYTMEDGFAHNGTSFKNSIFVGEDGFVWFATYQGLSRFDGEAFKNYKNNPADSLSLPQNLLTAVGEGFDENIWVGTVYEGVFILNKKSDDFQQLRIDDELAKEILATTVLFIEKDAAGYCWIGTENGVFSMDENGHIRTVNSNISAANDWEMDSKGNIWVAAANGLFRWEVATNQWQVFQLPFPQAQNGFLDLIEYTEGRLWLATLDKTFWEFDTQKFAFQKVEKRGKDGKNLQPIFFAKGTGESIWIAGIDIIYHYDSRYDEFVGHHFKENAPLRLPPSSLLSSMSIGAGGALFVMTYYHGIGIAQTRTTPFHVFAEHNGMEILPLQNDSVLVRTYDEGTWLYHLTDSATHRHQLPIPSGKIFTPTMTQTDDGLIWYWTPKYIAAYNPSTGETRLAPPNPKHKFYIQKDHNGRLWNSLSWLDEENNRWVDFYPELKKAVPDLASMDDYGYAKIYFSEDEKMWISLAEYLNFICYDLKTKTAKTYPFKVHTLEGGRNGKFFTNTSNGLGIYLPVKDTFLLLTEKDGLKHSSVFMAKEDEDYNIWIASSRGLQQYHFPTRTFTNYDFEDGFPAARGAQVRQLSIDEQNRIWFDIDMKKQVYFNPNEDQIERVQSTVFLEDFYLNQKRLTPNNQLEGCLTSTLRYQEELDLASDQNNFGFRFTMPFFYKPAAIEYFYQLAPFQNSWQSNGKQNIIHFTNISPGSYTFRVKAKSPAGGWSSNEASIRIIVHPPWYQTWWFYGLCALALVLLFNGIRIYELNRRLAAAEARRLKEMNHFKTRLYTNITHEFRTPLTVIMGVVEHIKGHIHERRLIRRNSKSLLRLIDQMLDLAKLDAQKMTVDNTPSDLIAFLRYLVESFALEAKNKSVQLNFQSPLSAFPTAFDKEKLQQILYNLLSNAFKFTPKGGKISLTCKEHTNHGEQGIIIEVADSGIGMSLEKSKKIFDRFYQIELDNQTPIRGTGIGLAWTKEIVELLGGTIQVESAPNQGSRFTISLPLVRQEISEKQLSTTISESILSEKQLSAISDKNGSIQTEKPLLLIIEDNPDVAAYLKMFLDKNYHLEYSENGASGIEKAIEIVPDIIISDVMMPQKNGYEVCRTLKIDQLTSHIPIILLTAKAEQSDKVAGLRYGADAYLKKPFDRTELLVRLEKLRLLRQQLQQRYSQLSPKSVGSSKSPLSAEDKFLAKLHAATLEVMADSHKTIEALEKKLAMSQMQLYRKLKALTNLTPSLYIRSVRLEKAMKLLKTTDLNVSEIAYDVGFNTPAYFSRAFSERYGCAPSQVREK